MLKVLNNPFLSSFYTLVCVLSLNWFLPIFDSLLAEASLYTRLEIIAYLIVAISLELFVYFVVTKLYKGRGARHLRTLILTLILTANLTGLLLTFYEPFLIQDKIYKIGEFFALMAVLYGLCLALEHKKFIVGGLSLLYVLMVTQQLIVLATAGNDSEEPATFNQFKSVEFKKNPNVYILSFDSFMPRALASKNLGLNTLQYLNVLEQNGARRFKNTFSDQSTTMSSLPLVFYLDPALWAKNIRTNHKIFSGLAPSPMLEIFKSNGYKIRTAYGGNYKLKGKYVDEFLSIDVVKSYCDFALPWYYMQHLGYCSFKMNVLNRYFARTNGIDIDFNELVLDSFSNQYKSAEPWLNFIYFFIPGHTPQDYSHAVKSDREKYAAFFSQNQKLTAKFIQLLITEISTNDPDSIILIFGDHGPWMSRGLELNDENAEFVVQDRHAIVSAIYPGDACTAYIAPQKGDTFVTPSGLVRQLITCLSNGDDPIDWDVDYSGPYEDYKFSDFIYE